MYPHEVWNDTDEDRVILMLHLKRPLRFPRLLLFVICCLRFSRAQSLRPGRIAKPGTLGKIEGLPLC